MANMFQCVVCHVMCNDYENELHEHPEKEGEFVCGDCISTVEDEIAEREEKK